MTERPEPTKIVCVGRNYVKHAEELGGVVPERPLIFLKPPSAVITGGDPIVRPGVSERVDHEGEIAIEIGTRCRRVPEADALAHVAGYRALNDVTARDLQRVDDQWSRAKGFDTFCPLGPLAPAEGIDPDSLEIVCRVDGVVRQHGRSRELAFPIPFLIQYISGIMTLEPGDLIATGTPEGVGPLRAGMVVEVELLAHGETLSAVRNPVVDERG